MNIILCSTKRSTHHAFLESVLSGKDYFYENNVVYREGIPVAAEFLGDEKYSDQLHIKSFEMSYDPSEVLFSGDIFERGGEAIRIVFIRDPLNTLASTLSVYYKFLGSSKEKKLSWVERNIELWCSLYDAVKKSGDKVAFVYANMFWSDPEYRDSISQIFGGNAVQLDSLSTFAGGGNSFFSNPSVSFSELDSRFLVYKDDRLYLDFLEKYSREFVSFLEKFKDEYKLEFVQSVCSS